MGTYAANTDVSQEKSRAEIETTLRRYGADAFSYGWEERKAVIVFRANDRHVRFEIHMPDPKDEEFTLKKTRVGANQNSSGVEKVVERTQAQAYTLWEQATRQRWRALALVVKAKLEAVDAGISQFEEEFLANIVLPDGSTVGQFVMPEIAKVYLSGKMPKRLMLGPMSGEDKE
ncbi:MAG: hypothetical protein ABL952_17630 [Pyrinomonadaceae bacterium]